MYLGEMYLGEDVLRQRCTYEDVLTKMYLVRMYLRRCTYKDVLTRMYLAKMYLAAKYIRSPFQI